jgi:erythronate-4-phosphate dehydrogenase
MKLLADATLPHLRALFTPSFSLTLYHRQDELTDLIPTHDILLCRSTLKVTEQLLSGSTIQCVATASSGIDHIDNDYLKKNKIPLFDAKGCNASAVADYVVATLAFLYQTGRIGGTKAGVIGVGEVGTRVIARLQSMGFDVICYDPIKAELDTHYSYRSLAELTTCDLLCVHANLHQSPPYPSANLLSADFLTKLKPGTVIINAARGGIINEEDLLKVGKSIVYCTDVYQGEPAINPELVDFSTLCTPHIAGHSIEAKNAAVLQISQQLHHYYGFIPPSTQVSIPDKNSVFFPKNRTKNSSWQECILALYNPLLDTQILKESNNKALAFVTQRQAHQHRHDFAFYSSMAI